jgi:hypothetical protein
MLTAKGTGIKRAGHPVSLPQQLTPTTANPTLNDAILPRRPDAGAFGLQACRVKEGEDVSVEL